MCNLHHRPLARLAPARLLHRLRALIRRLDQICAGAASWDALRGLSPQERPLHHHALSVHGHHGPALHAHPSNHTGGHRPSALEIDP
ncbi:hypothetical protein V7S57_11405 [Caulobacter sp. CCNWLY153]|uniref:hypothetical protein n=1 Tax=Caulobacter TaxID=75 RepID=UPI001057604B|nr:hypothetical protein [Caulobacter radicis]